MTIPFADPIAISLLVGLDVVGDRVSTDVEEVPSIRVTLAGDAEPPATWERTPIFQIEVWASSEFEAGTIATEIANRWPTIRRVNAGGGYVSGCWIESFPRPLPAPDSDHARYFMEIGLRIHTSKEP